MNNFIQTFGADGNNKLIPLPIQNTMNGAEGTFQFTSGVQETVAQNIAPDTTKETMKQSLICPPDITQEQAEKFSKLGLTYELSSAGHYLCVYRDRETNEVSKFVYHPQVWINAHAPENVTWQKDGITSHDLGNTNKAWHFNKTKKGLTTYIKNTLTPNGLALANRVLTQKLANIFKGDMHTAFGIDFTSWSSPGGNLGRDVVGHYAGSWLVGGYLSVDRGVAWVNDGFEGCGLGLFLQDTSSGT